MVPSGIKKTRRYGGFKEVGVWANTQILCAASPLGIVADDPPGSGWLDHWRQHDVYHRPGVPPLRGFMPVQSCVEELAGSHRRKCFPCLLVPHSRALTDDAIYYALWTGGLSTTID